MKDLILKNVYKSYDNGVVAVKDFNIEVEKGEFIVFVGPSGCGKSTTLRMIAGLEDITSGKILLDNNLINNVAPKDRDIAMVFQNYALYAHMTVYENMGFSLRMRRHSSEEIHEKVMKAADILGLKSYLNRKPKALSGGQRQRVALGRAIVREPKIFLLDEPLSNLDAKLRVTMRKEIKTLHNYLKTTMIYVTHDQVEALTLADRVVVMKDGVIQQIASPKEIYEIPSNMFVGSFIGIPPMSFLKSRLLSDNKLLIEDKDIMDIPYNTFKYLSDKGYLNKEFYIGIRSENINFVEKDENSLKAKVEIYEMMGSSSLVHFNYNNKELIGKVNSKFVYKTNQTIFFSFNFDKISYFNIESTLRI